MKAKGVLLCMLLVLVLSVSMSISNVKAPTPEEAIDKGVAWLAAQQNPDGSFTTWYRVAKTAFAVIKFATHKHMTGDTTYDGNVTAGLTYLYDHAYTVDIGVQPAGDPDTNGNGIGIYFQSPSAPHPVYETGIVMMALEAASRCGFIDPDDTVPSGPLAGKTFREVMTDMVDYYAWAQNEASAFDPNCRGGWRYSPNSDTSDNSVSQWPALGMIAAEAWGIFAPDWVKEELMIWLTYSQDPSGGFGYTAPGDWVNIAKTGAGLIMLAYCRVPSTDPKVVAAVGYMDTQWTRTGTGDDDNFGNLYAMYAVMKGCELVSPPIELIGTHDWNAEYTEWLVANQDPDGSWKWTAWEDVLINTEWALLVLQKVIPPPPPPPPPPPRPVGGFELPINRLGLLAPWIALASVVTVVAIVFVKHRKKKT